MPEAMTDWVEVLRNRDAYGRARVPVWRSTTPNWRRMPAITTPSISRHRLSWATPKRTRPAYGWVDGLRAEDGKLLARFTQVH